MSIRFMADSMHGLKQGYQSIQNRATKKHKEKKPQKAQKAQKCSSYILCLLWLCKIDS